LILICGALVLNFFFKFNSRRYTTDALPSGMQCYYGDHNGEPQHVYEPSVFQLLEEAGRDNLQFSFSGVGGYIRSKFSST